MDNEIVDKLIKVLEQEAMLYEEILNLARNKTNIIAEGKVAELENMVKVEQSMLFHVGRLEDQREQLVEELSGQFGLKQQEVTLSELIKHVDDASRQKLEAWRGKMIDTIKELRNSNELNSKLIKNSLDYINFSINVFTEMNAVNNSYGNNGQASDSKKRNLFDVKL